MRFGYFDDKNREYVITTPKTPYPWINYLGSENFFALVSHRAGGYCFYRDARLRRLMRYRYNNVPTDVGGRYFYINDGGDVWNPSFAPTKAALDAFECRHGLGYTRITGERKGVRASLLMLVPPGHTAEVHELRIKNTSSGPKSLKVFSFIEWCLWNAYDDMTNYQRNFSTGEVEIERGGATIYHKTEYRERRDHYAFYNVNAEVAGFDTDRETFFGLYNDWSAPDVALKGASSKSVASGWAPIASHGLDVNLAPGEEKSSSSRSATSRSRAPRSGRSPASSTEARPRADREVLHARTSSRRDEAAGGPLVQAALELRRRVERREAEPDGQHLEPVPVHGDVQHVAQRLVLRDGDRPRHGVPRLEPGPAGLRPPGARARAERIIDIASTQFPDGSAYHQYQPLTKRGNNDVGSGFNDDPLWLIFGVAAYIRETGDYSILDEQVPFDNDPKTKTTLFEHLKRSFNYTLNNLGPHGLPLIGRADWNDCLNLNCFSETPDESFQTTGNRTGRTAESVFIAGMFVGVAPDYAYLAEKRGLADEAKLARAESAKMSDTILKHGWDGEWFLRAYDFFGNKVGTKETKDSQIFIEPQGFCVMAGVGVEGGQAKKALDSVKERLDTKYGIVLNNPPYSEYHVELGEISSYPPGYKENAGIFCHNNPWVIIAETVIGRGDRAFEYWKKIAPAYLEEQSEVHRLEPYVYAQMIAGKDAVRHGEAKNSWLTGTAAWNFVAVSQYLLGVRPDFEGLRVHPCMGGEVGKFTVTRKCRGAEYRINVKNSGKGGAPKLTVDGKPIAGDLVPYAKPGSTVIVDCEV